MSFSKVFSTFPTEFMDKRNVLEVHVNLWVFSHCEQKKLMAFQSLIVRSKKNKNLVARGTFCSPILHVYNFFWKLNKKMKADWFPRNSFVPVGRNIQKVISWWKKYQNISVFGNRAWLFRLIFVELSLTCNLQSDQHVSSVTLCLIFSPESRTNLAIFRHFCWNKFCWWSQNWPLYFHKNPWLLWRSYFDLLLSWRNFRDIFCFQKNYQNITILVFGCQQFGSFSGKQFWLEFSKVKSMSWGYHLWVFQKMKQNKKFVRDLGVSMLAGVFQTDF